ncbi:glycosyl hydrolase [Ktedonosporobacter rubrisoli]|uniref:Glycosyl hydrolase n=1 Tax=Ktedonosporobacter rubrisoli TaxID=2509675 RepID=A0A4V0YY35_KTERU|nr:glycosyl hydrolase [Ktedonosporobacter rubrisoli]QBD74841.1 glycosyl hydrolase [Ktedonosporobacter rubrisoli]
MKFYVPMLGKLLVAEQQSSKWQLDSHLVGIQTMCLAIDPFHAERVYCGTYGRGLWRSNDAGHSWEPIGDVPFITGKGGISSGNITAIAVSPTERSGEYGVVYVGTEPSMLFRSEDGGASWQELRAFRELPSASSWSFPPKPATSHVRYITPDLHTVGRVFVAVEAGALVRSLDGGQHWEDRVPAGPIDTHTLVMHPAAPNRLYSAAGDGFSHPGKGYQESYDAGLSWQYPDEGLSEHYLRSVAVDPADPDTIVITAAATPPSFSAGSAEPAIYRKTRGKPWQKVWQEKGSMLLHVASHEAEPGVFYAAGFKGIYRSPDAGLTWDQLAFSWGEEGITGEQLARARNAGLMRQFPQALALSDV